MNMTLETAKRFVRNLLLPFSKLVKICRDLDEDELWRELYMNVFTSERDLDMMIGQAREIGRPDAWKRLRSLINPNNPDYTRKQGRLIARNIPGDSYLHEVKILSPFWSIEKIVDNMHRQCDEINTQEQEESFRQSYEKFERALDNLGVLAERLSAKALETDRDIDPIEVIELIVDLDIEVDDWKREQIQKLLREDGLEGLGWSSRKEMIKSVLDLTTSTDMADYILRYLNRQNSLTNQQVFELGEMYEEYGLEVNFWSFLDLNELETDELVELTEAEDDPELWKKVAIRLEWEKSDPESRPIFSESVENALDLSVRTHNALESIGVETVGELVMHNESDLLSSRNFGRKSLRELQEVLEEHDLSLNTKVA